LAPLPWAGATAQADWSSAKRCHPANKIFRRRGKKMVKGLQYGVIFLLSVVKG